MKAVIVPRLPFGKVRGRAGNWGRNINPNTGKMFMLQSMSRQNLTRLSLGAALLAGFTFAAPALAEEATPAFKFSGSVAILNDYRLRGVSQTDKGATIQGSMTLTHSSGFYISTFASNLAGWGTFGGPNLELDLIGGYSIPVGALKLDGGITWYNYPGGATLTSYVEPYFKLSGALGPVSITGAVAYVPNQKAAGNWFATPTSVVGSKYDNLYLWTDISSGIPGTPVTLKAHVGHSDGNPGLGPNGTSLAPTGKYWDFLVGADFAIGPVVIGVAWVDTDIKTSSVAYQQLQPNFSSTKDGSTIAGSKFLVSLSAAF